MITILVPSRGRPARMRDMAQSALDTAARPDQVRVLALTDPDDSGYGRDAIVLPQRVGYSASLNWAAAFHADDILGAYGDDVLFRTQGWDERTRDTLNRPGIAFGEDLIHNDQHPTAIFMSPEVRRALGWLALPCCRHQYVDDGWKALGKAAGILRYMPGVVFEHMHPTVEKAEWDATYHEVYSYDSAHADDLAFQDWRDHGGLKADAAALKAAGL
jgi:hypothetical protein